MKNLIDVTDRKAGAVNPARPTAPGTEAVGGGEAGVVAGGEILADDKCALAPRRELGVEVVALVPDPDEQGLGGDRLGDGLVGLAGLAGDGGHGGHPGLPKYRMNLSEPWKIAGTDKMIIMTTV
jgi:hypothetical protein